MTDREWDYIVVGAGSAGSVVAARLSEDPGVRVLLVEAGGPADADIFTVPALWGRQITTMHDWDYISEPEPFLDNRRNFLPRGKALGGTSSMNAMLYVRGAPADFDGWAASGAPGWAWDDVLPYFKRAEGNVRGADALHAADGPLTVSERRSENPIVEGWVDAAVDAGYAINDDFNGPDQEGVGYYQVTTRDGRRCSTALAYLQPAAGRPNLCVLTYAQVSRLLLEGNRAVGVELDHRGETERLVASREVILCAGAYNSPQLLMQAGIGHADHLRSLGIPVVADLPVGDNLQDHPGVPMAVVTDGPSMRTIDDPANWKRWDQDRRGPLSTNIIEAGGFFRTEPGGGSDCDVQIVVQPMIFREDGRGTIAQDGFTAVVEVTRPTSVGTVRLRSSVPSAKPRVTHNQLSTAEDRATLERGVRVSMEIMARPPMADVARGTAIWPKGDDSDSLQAFLRTYGLGVFHPSSSCSIGPVVDSQLRVHGIDGLRIADASVLPTTIRGNPNAACVMVGERAADLVTGRPALRSPDATALSGSPIT